ncbi:MAG: sialate O-acetylesterase [Ruminococcaceae bacterium]|nr:sialate O-acetylesterase [Oscillospiraceae bacterium]
MKNKLFYATILATGIFAAGALCGCSAGKDSKKKPITKANFTVNTSVPESEDLKIPDLIGEKAVLQQNSVIKFWGSYTEDCPVAVCVNDTFYYGECVNGTFELLIRTEEASKGNTITVYTQKEKKTINDVWFGEVFLCAGQSNMQFTLSEFSTPPQQASRDVRVATVPVLQLKAPVTTPMTDTDMVWLNMQDSLPNVSAVGYYFAEKMAEELKCPIGIVVCAAGDTIVASWLPEEKASQLPPIYQETRNDYYWVRTASHMYNTMLSPILKGTFKSVIWYQGENQSYQYDIFLTEMINCWREKFEQPKLPFTIIELVGCGDSWIQNWPEIRVMQRKVSEELDNCTISVNIDLGEKNNIHPFDKEPVALRAAYATLNALYNGKYPDSPVLQKTEFKDNTLRLTFSNDEGMIIKGNAELAFEISPDGRAWYGASAHLDGNTVVLTYDENIKPVSVRYAWANYCADMAVLYNKDSMPADTFLVELDKSGKIKEE